MIAGLCRVYDSTRVRKESKNMTSMGNLPPRDAETTLSEVTEQSKAEWQHRCVEKMLAIQPGIDMIEATQLAIAMWSIERFRRRGPEAMAEVMFSNGAVRPSKA
jgi:inorganic triphosphatase YgiF